MLSNKMINNSEKITSISNSPSFGDIQTNTLKKNLKKNKYEQENILQEESMVLDESIKSETQQTCKPVNFKKQDDGTFCYVNSKGNLICNHNSIYCNNEKIENKCQKNDIKYGIDNNLDSAINTLLDYLNTNSNNMKENCVPVVKEYINKWGLKPHLNKYYNLFSRIAFDDPSPKARAYFSSNSLLINVMIKISEDTDTEETINEIQQEETINGIQQEETINGLQQEEIINELQQEEIINKLQQEETINELQQEETINKLQQEETINKLQQEYNDIILQENNIGLQEEDINIIQEEEKIRFQNEEQILNSCQYSQYGCCPDGKTNRYDIKGSNCLKYPNPVQPYSNQNNNYVLNSNENQNITYVTNPQNTKEIPDNGPFNRTLYIYNQENDKKNTGDCQKCPDMSKYIRKDKIPCWGCNLE